MKDCQKDGIPAFLASLLFLVVEGINVLEIVPSQKWNDFEILSNAFMIMIAVIGFFCLGIPSKTRNNGNLGSVLGNMAVPIIAFPMNIDVFGHVIRLEQLPDDLLGWHSAWIICVFIQMLFLSELGKKLLSYILKMEKAVKHIVGQMDSFLSNVTSDIQTTVNKINKSILVGITLWVIYFAILIYIKGLQKVLYDTDFFWMSIWLWLSYFIICIVANTMPVIIQKIIEVIPNLNGKKVLASLLAIIFVALASKLPSLLNTIIILLLIPIVLLMLPWFFIRGIIKTSIYFRALKHRISSSGVTDSEGEDIYFRDLVIVLTSFFVIPLMILYIITFLKLNEVQSIDTWDLTDVTTWIEFINASVEVSKSLLKLFI